MENFMLHIFYHNLNISCCAKPLGLGVVYYTATDNKNSCFMEFVNGSLNKNCSTLGITLQMHTNYILGSDFKKSCLLFSIFEESELIQILKYMNRI